MTRLGRSRLVSPLFDVEQDPAMAAATDMVAVCFKKSRLDSFTICSYPIDSCPNHYLCPTSVYFPFIYKM